MRSCETSSFVYVLYVFLGNFMASLELRREVREDTQHKRSPTSQGPAWNLERYLQPPPPEGCACAASCKMLINCCCDCGDETS